MYCRGDIASDATRRNRHGGKTLCQRFHAHRRLQDHFAAFIVKAPLYFPHISQMRAV